MKKIVTILCFILVVGAVLATSACTKKTTETNGNEGSSITNQTDFATKSEPVLSIEQLTTLSSDLLTDSSDPLTTTTEANTPATTTLTDTPEITTPFTTNPFTTNPFITNPSTNTSSDTTTPDTTPPDTTPPDTNSSPNQASSTPDAPRYDYSINRNIVNWIYDGDIVYSLSSSPNKLWVFNATNMQTIADITLPGTPAEIHLINNELLISFPILNSIKYYDKNSLVLNKSLELPNIVSSFAISNGFVYYSEDDQWCQIFRTNISTLETVPIEGYNYYYEPTVFVNESDNLLYVVESGVTRSNIHYFDLDTLNLTTETQGYGYTNITRTAFFDGYNLYTINFKIDRLDANSIVGEYNYGPSSYSQGLLFVNDDYVITIMAMFNKKTMEPLYELNNNFQKALITKSEYLLLFDGSILYVLPNE